MPATTPEVSSVLRRARLSDQVFDWVLEYLKMWGMN